MKKLLTMLLTLSLACTALTACKDRDKSSKTAELEKRVADLESQISKQLTTTTTTSIATTTVPNTTTTIKTFSTDYYAYDSSLYRITKYDIDLYAAPNKQSEVLYSLKKGTALEIIGEVDSDWEVALVDGNIVFIEKFTLDVSTTTTIIITKEPHTLYIP